MPASWSGSIVFGMVSVPVQLFKATETHAGPKFHQVHEPDGGRIRLKRFCEAEDAEVPYGEIAKGYDVDDDEQLVLTSEDLDSLPIPSKSTIEVQAFVDAAEFDPIQFDQAYYVGLGKRSPAKPYALLREAMREDGKVAVAKLTLTTRESLAILRVVDDLLVLHTMLWPDEVRSARGIEPPEETVHANELKMAHSLMDTMSQGFSLDDMHDEYREAVEDMIEAKLHGRAPTAQRPAPASNVVDITEILARSLEAEQSRRTGRTGTGRSSDTDTAAKAPAKKAAAKKTAAKKTTAGTRSAAKKTTAKKAAPRPAAKKSAGTRKAG
jgi:DNA end-binding protein Ku